LFSLEQPGIVLAGDLAAVSDDVLTGDEGRVVAQHELSETHHAPAKKTHILRNTKVVKGPD